MVAFDVVVEASNLARLVESGKKLLVHQMDNQVKLYNPSTERTEIHLQNGTLHAPHEIFHRRLKQATF